MKDTFIHGGIPQSKPTPDAVTRDWTNETLTLDIKNSLGETYYFEIPPNASHKNIPNIKSEAPLGRPSDWGRVINIYIPL